MVRGEGIMVKTLGNKRRKKRRERREGKDGEGQHDCQRTDTAPEVQRAAIEKSPASDEAPCVSKHKTQTLTHSILMKAHYEPSVRSEQWLKVKKDYVPGKCMCMHVCTCTCVALSTSMRRVFMQRDAWVLSFIYVCIYMKSACVCVHVCICK